MAAKSLEQLTEEAKTLGIAIPEGATAGQIKELIANNTPGSQDTEKEPTEEELKAASEAAKEQLKKQGPEKAVTFTEDQQELIKNMISSAVKNVLDSKKEDMDAPEQHENDPDQLRLARFTNKFIVDFKNMNEDEYFKDVFIESVDVWDEKTRRPIPWVTLIFEDGSELFVQLETALKRSTKVKSDIIKIEEVDISYSFGKVEQVAVEEYATKGTGNMKNLKVTQKKYNYTVKHPITGKDLQVSARVINW